MSEALIPIIDLAFKKLKLRRIDISAASINKGSNELIKKFGFIYEGTRRSRTRVRSTGKIYDENIYGMLRDEWPKARKRIKI